MGAANDSGLLVADFRKSSGSRSARNISGTRYLADNDPATDAILNPAKGSTEFLRRLLGRSPRLSWREKMGFPAITEAYRVPQPRCIGTVKGFG
jgi:hypothetical protein